MRVQIISADQPAESLQPMAHVPGEAGPPASYGPWHPRAVLGAQSAGGLLLPNAEPTASQMYGPRAAHIDSERVIVADSGNHRVLIFAGHPDQDGAEACVVLGQRDERSEGPQAGGLGPERGMHLPTGILVHDGRLVVADAWNHRLLIWNQVPSKTDTAPDLILGQADATGVDPNRGGEPTAASFYWPFGIAVIGGQFLVADTGNRRVLIFGDGIPDSPDIRADVVLGQDDETARDENRGGEASASSFRWPHAIVPDPQGGMAVADAGNHRVLGWSRIPSADIASDYVLGQPDHHSAVEFPYRPQTGTTMRFPYGMTALTTPAGAHGLAIADTANNRVLVWNESPLAPSTHPDHVLAQPDFSANGENRWQHVDADTLCWPYGLGSFHTGSHQLLAVADSGNNRVVLWERP